MKRILAVLLAAMMLLGCTAMAELSEIGVIPLSEETIKFTIGVGQSAVIEDWETNAQTLELEKDLNIDLEFVELPSDANELKQKVELMIMAGGEELPDILMTGAFGLADLVKYGEMGMIIPTTDYYKNGYAYFTEETLATGGYTLEERLRYVTCYDNEVYGVFGFADTVHNSYSNSFIFVYEPYLKELGLDKPVTTDDFVEMLRMFKNNDVNGNGVADEIPLMGYNGTVKGNLMRFLMNPFVYTQSNFWSLQEDGTIDFVADNDAWKEGIKWVKSLFDEGLISPLSFTQDQAALTAIMNDEPEVVCCLARISASNLGANDSRRGDYFPLDPLMGPEGVRNHTREPILPSIRAVITCNCKNPEAAFRFLDYMCSEKMSVWNRYGEYGVDWTDPAEGSVGTFENLGYPAKLTALSTWGVLQNQWYAQTGPNILTAQWGSGQAVTTEAIASNAAAAIGRGMGKCIEYANPNPLTGFIFNEDEQEVVNEYQSTINDYVNNSWAEFVTGVRDIDKEWDTYVQAFARMGLNEYMESIQSCYDRMYK